MANGTVGLLYLSGDGTLDFTHRATGATTAVDVKPGRLLTWDNAEYTHRLVAGRDARAMLGPLKFKDGAFAAVAAAYWNQVTNFGTRPLMAAPGTIVTATSTFVIIDWFSPTNSPPTDLVVTISHNAPPGRLAFLKGALSPNTWRAKVQPAVAGPAAVSFTIPAAQVPLLKELKAVCKYRLARDAPSGTRIVFTLDISNFTTTLSFLSSKEDGLVV